MERIFRGLEEDGNHSQQKVQGERIRKRDGWLGITCFTSVQGNKEIMERRNWG